MNFKRMYNAQYRKQLSKILSKVERGIAEIPDKEWSGSVLIFFSIFSEVRQIDIVHC